MPSGNHPTVGRRAGWAASVAVALVFAGPADSRPPDPPFHEAIVTQLNEARTRPADYVRRLEAWRALFAGDRVVRPGEPDLITVEGAAAVDEAIAALRAAEALRPVTSDHRLDRSAGDHAAEQGRSGATGHDSADGASPAERMARHGRWRATAEIIAYGAETPEEVIVQLLVDDDVPDRGHRRIIFNPVYTLVGVGCGPHPVYRRVCVINLALPY